MAKKKSNLDFSLTPDNEQETILNCKIEFKGVKVRSELEIDNLEINFEYTGFNSFSEQMQEKYLNVVSELLKRF